MDALFAVASDREIWAGHPSHNRWQEPVFRAFFDDALAGAIEIGWPFLAREYWGKGYNAEFKRLMLAHALAHFERVEFQVGARNVISRGAMTNIGGRLVPRVGATYDRCGVMIDHVVFEITRDSFAWGPLSDRSP